MSKGRSLNFQTAYVVIRVDKQIFDESNDVDEQIIEKSIDTHEKDGLVVRAGKYEIIVKEVVLSLEKAERETKRLNKINADKSYRYFWQSTHLFLDGGSHGSLEK